VWQNGGRKHSGSDGLIKRYARVAAIDSESLRELTLPVRLGLAVAARYFPDHESCCCPDFLQTRRSQRQHRQNSGFCIASQKQRRQSHRFPRNERYRLLHAGHSEARNFLGMKEQSRPFKSSQKGFRFRSSAEFRSGIVHPFTTLRLSSMRTVRSSRNTERPTWFRLLRSKSATASHQGMSSAALTSPGCGLD